MSRKETVIQELENASEPLLEKILELIHSQHEPLNAYLGRLKEQGEYADDVTEQELASSDSAYQDYLEGKDRNDCCAGQNTYNV